MTQETMANDKTAERIVARYKAATERTALFGGKLPLQEAEAVINRAAHSYVSFLQRETGKSWRFHEKSPGRLDETTFTLTATDGEEVHANVRFDGIYDVVLYHRIGLERITQSLKVPLHVLGDGAKLLGSLIGPRRVANIRKAAVSTPMGYRLVRAFIQVAGDTATDTFGRAVYAEFIRKGVTEMPDVHGKPATQFDANSPNAASKLPVGYGKGLGEKAAKTLYSLGFNTADVHDVLMTFLLKMLNGNNIKSDYNVHQADGYVLRGVKLLGLTLLRDRKRHVTSPLTHEEGGETVDLDLEDPRAYRQVERDMTSEQLEKFFAFLRTIHPDLPLYFQLSADGVPDKRIIQDGMLPRMKEKFKTEWDYVSFHNWKKREVEPAIIKYFRTTHPNL